jgi:tetratricopeptide (TPR) repeat protein
MALLYTSSSMVASGRGSGGPPAHDWRIPPSGSFVPILLKGIVVPFDNPESLHFIVDNGDSGLHGPALERETEKLIRYFVDGLTIKEDDLWVNLSAYESGRTIPPVLGASELGRVMIEQDLVLKRFSASLLDPETELGARYWEAVLARSETLNGSGEGTIDTFQKVWVIPDKAVVYEGSLTGRLASSRIATLTAGLSGVRALIVESSLKIMSQKDLRARGNIPGVAEQADESDLYADIFEELIAPAIQREMDQGRNFAEFRQIYSALILAAWFKEVYRDDPLRGKHVDSNRPGGLQLRVRHSSQPADATPAVRASVVLAGAEEADFLVFAENRGFALEWLHVDAKLSLACVELDGADQSIFGGSTADQRGVLTPRASARTYARLHLGEHITATFDVIVGGLEVTIEAPPEKAAELASAAALLKDYRPEQARASELAHLLAMKARAHHLAHEFELGIASAEKAVQLDSACALAWNALGASHVGLGRDREAISFYKRAVAEDPRLVRAWVNLGNRYTALGERAEARVHYERAAAVEIEILSEEQELRLTALEELERFQEALALGRQLLAALPDSVRSAALRERVQSLERQLHPALAPTTPEGPGTLPLAPSMPPLTTNQSSAGSASQPISRFFAQYLDLFEGGVHRTIKQHFDSRGLRIGERLYVSGGASFCGLADAVVSNESR